ncbi:PHB depolymerase family esterase [Tianweitania sp. Rool2]|uniref:PHB depolymerase family esterase n=2 Tax=Oryzicola mucosus TaxID=2767425 RepID=A0A8J6U7S2_9HYPH|nr:PHB depolymerase family esterase [Oryzicola mucosus]
MSDTIARLAAIRAQQTAFSPDAGPNGDLKELMDFGSNPGALKAKFYLPDNLAEGAPLVVVLHGCTQTATAYDHGSGWSDLADRAGFALLYAEQQRANNPNLCFNWFVPGDTRRDAGEALSIRQMIDTMVSAHGLDRKRIFVTGLSAGGAMASVMLAAYPEVFAGGAIIAGLPYGSANTVPEAFDRMRGHGGPSERQLQQLLASASPHKGPWPRISIWQGTADQTVAASNADAIAGQWRGVHGLEKTPTRSQTIAGHSRDVWCDDSGNEVMEAYTIAYMGHGTPLMTKGAEGLGAAGPFMLDAGISSTRHIAKFWGIADAVEVSTELPTRKQDSKVSELSRTPTNDLYVPETPRRGASSSAPEEEATGVRKVIEDALRTAGLMR